VISIVLRKLQEPMEFGGRVLPAGVSIVPAIHLVHRRPDIYPEPNEFRPERFIEAEGGTDWMPARPYTWIPFGGGVRRCLGAAFAQFEMEVVLRELVLRRTLAPSRPRSEPNYRRAITETPRHDAEVLVGRQPASSVAPAGCPVAHRGAESEPQAEVEIESRAKAGGAVAGEAVPV
jgi:cytochrome P450